MTNQLKTSILMLLFSIALGSCEKQISITPQEKSSEQTQIAAQAEGKTQDGKKAFDPCKWVWGDFPKLKKPKNRNPFEGERKSMCTTIPMKKPLVIDSMTICYDTEDHSSRWLTLYIDGSRQDIKLDGGGFGQGWSIDSTLCNPSICFGNYNNDDYLDFHLRWRGGTAGSNFEFFLYNNKRKIFERSEILSTEYSLSYDRKNNVYQSLSRGGGFNYIGERFIIINGKKYVLKALDVSTAEIRSDYSVIRKFMEGRDTLIKIYKMDELQRDEDKLFNLDKYCKDFLAFKMKYRLK